MKTIEGIFMSKNFYKKENCGEKPFENPQSRFFPRLLVEYNGMYMQVIRNTHMNMHSWVIPSHALIHAHTLCTHTLCAHTDAQAQ
jgi:hypothetical protein